MNLKSPKSFKELESLKNFMYDCDSNLLRLPHDREFFGLFMNLVPKGTSLDMIDIQMHGKDIALIRNNFPYTFVLQDLPKVKHYCLWSKKGKLSEEEISITIESYFPKNKWFQIERRTDRKSVPEIWHTHVFIQEK